MALLHVQELDGENVRGLPKLLGGKEKRCRLMLHGGPPLYHRGDARQLHHSQGAQDAQNVQVRMRLVKIAARRGAVQNNRLEVISRRFMQPFNQVLQRFVHIAHCVPQTLPASGRPAASATATAEPAKSSAARAATKSASSPTATHPAKHRSNPPAATTTSSAACGSSPGSRNRENNPDDKEYRPQANWRRMLSLPLLRGRRWLACQQYAAILRDVFREHPRCCIDCRAVVSLAQQRHHHAARVSGTGIVDHRLQPVPNFNTILVLVRSNQQQHAAIVALASDSELLVQIHRKVLDAFSLQRMHGNDRDLRAGLFFDLAAKRFQPRLRI